LGLALPVTGELSGTWGDTVNNSLTALLDTAVAGTTTLSSDADVTLSTTTLAANQARQAVILWTAGGTVTRNITAPAQSKTYVVINKTSSTQSIKIVGAGPTTGVTIVAGTAALVAWNGLDFVTVSVMSVTGIVQVANGGTGATTLTGILKGNGTGAFTAATAGTDYVAPGTATTFTAKQTFVGTSSNADMKTSNILEVDTITATAATGTINFDLTTQSVLYYTSNSSGNFTINFRGSSGTSLNTIMATGECISATFLCTNNATAYYNSAVTIDGNSVTPKWQGGTAPTSGNASAVDCYTYVLQKTGSATYVVLASVTKFA
jgi:hypothetical protein